MNDKLFWYKIYGNVLCSEVEYPQLIITADRTPQIFLKVIPMERKLKNEQGCFVDTVSKSYIYFCNQVGVFRITNGISIEIYPNKDISIDKLTPFVFGYCMAMLFWQRGMIAIHCSAVEYNGEAIIIAGGSGSGKSTLTTRLIENGCRLMTDDLAILGTADNGDILVYSAFPQQKLCRDAVYRNHLNTEDLLYIDEDKDKFALVRRDIFCEKVTKLSGMVCLAVHPTDTKIRFSKLNGHKKLISIMENQFLFPMFRSSGSFSPEDMQTCLHIAQTVPIYQIIRPDGIDSTSEQMDYIMKTILNSEEG